MNASSRPICWLHACFRVPADWEITAYSVEEREGRLEFSTRKGFQGLLAWEPCKVRPDRAALMAAFPAARGKQGKGRDAGEFHTVEVGDFVLGWGGDDGPCQALGYWEAARRRLRWAFPTAGTAEREHVVKPILESVEPNAGPSRRYCVFGLDFRLPAEYRIESMHARPADVEIVFESPKRTRVSFHRWGLPEVLLQGQSLEAFYSRFLRGRGAHVHRAGSATLDGMDGVEAAFSQTGEHQMDRFMGRAWTNGEARLWYDREAKRLYAFEQVGPRGIPLLPFRDVFVGPLP